MRALGLVNQQTVERERDAGRHARCDAHTCQYRPRHPTQQPASHLVEVGLRREVLVSAFEASYALFERRGGSHGPLLRSSLAPKILRDARALQHCGVISSVSLLGPLPPCSGPRRQRRRARQHLRERKLVRRAALQREVGLQQQTIEPTHRLRWEPSRLLHRLAHDEV